MRRIRKSLSWRTFRYELTICNQTNVYTRCRNEDAFKGSKVTSKVISQLNRDSLHNVWSLKFNSDDNGIHSRRRFKELHLKTWRDVRRVTMNHDSVIVRRIDLLPSSNDCSLRHQAPKRDDCRGWRC